MSKELNCIVFAAEGISQNARWAGAISTRWVHTRHSHIMLKWVCTLCGLNGVQNTTVLYWAVQKPPSRVDFPLTFPKLHNHGQPDTNGTLPVGKEVFYTVVLDSLLHICSHLQLMLGFSKSSFCLLYFNTNHYSPINPLIVKGLKDCSKSIGFSRLDSIGDFGVNISLYCHSQRVLWGSRLTLI